jgi:hypothetical protein
MLTKMAAMKSTLINLKMLKKHIVHVEFESFYLG